jgi:hypothetical protein
MTTLISKFQETTKRLQQLTVWRPTERDPFFELDRWRTDAHTTIEQIYNKKRQQIEHLMDKREREFMRQIARQRALLTSVRQRLSSSKEMNSSMRTQNDISILTDLQKIDNDINTKLGRAEIVIETTPINLDDSVMVLLKTYLSPTSSLYVKEISTRNQTRKSTPRSANEVIRAYDNWAQLKKQEEMALARKELQSAREYQKNLQENRSRKQKQNDEAFDNWMNAKKSENAFTKKRLSIHHIDIKQET